MANKIDASIYPDISVSPLSKSFYNKYDKFSLKGALDDEIANVSIFAYTFSILKQPNLWKIISLQT